MSQVVKCRQDKRSSGLIEKVFCKGQMTHSIRFKASRGVGGTCVGDQLDTRGRLRVSVAPSVKGRAG